MPNTPTQARRGAIQRLVEAAVNEPLLVAFLTLGLIAAGIFSLQRLPVDAYPDVSPTSVAMTTQWPGHAAEEVERLITVPIETALNGLPVSRRDAFGVAVRAVERPRHVRGRH